MNNGNVRFRCPYCGKISGGVADHIGMMDNCPFCGKSFRLTAVRDVRESIPNCLTYYFEMFKLYFCFRGRTRRREFWWAFLLNTIAGFLVAFLDGFFFSGYEYRNMRGVMVWGYLLTSFFPLLAIQVRRLHDTNKSGWWTLLSLMPVLNIAYLVWLVTNGDKGDNRFGKNPKGDE